MRGARTAAAPRRLGRARPRAGGIPGPRSKFFSRGAHTTHNRARGGASPHAFKKKILAFAYRALPHPNPTPHTCLHRSRNSGCGVTEADLRATADALVATGLARAGYTIVAPDDCWARSRGADGTIVPDPIAFPSGMRAVADYVRSKGLSFGLYTAIGNKTCAGRPGSAGFEAVDAATFAGWGVTWIKIDNCD